MAFSLQRLGLASSFLSIPLLITVAQAQVTPDGTLNTTVTQSGSNYTITNGTSAGTNLYHSFGQFSIPTGGSATFDLNATPAIRTIFSRVTGGSVSNIDGLLRTLNSTSPVSLFLMNPAGIPFGANAQLNLGGSFVATTANSIKFGDGSEFSAVNPAASLLTVSVPIGLQMGINPGAIVVQNTGHRLIEGNAPLQQGTTPGGLQVASGKTLALIGGDIVLDGGILTAPSGQLELGSVKVGTVNINTVSPHWNFDYSSLRDYGDIQFSHQALANASGVFPGSIHFQGRNISLNHGSVALLINQGNQGSGDLTVNASESLEMRGVGTYGFTQSLLMTDTIAGASGNLAITAPQLLLQDGAKITSHTFGSGIAGNISVVADSIQLSGFSALKPTTTRSGIASDTHGAGSAGNTQVTTRQLRMQEGGSISNSSFGTGATGNVSVNASESIEVAGETPINFNASLLGVVSFNRGNAGNVTVNTPRLSVQNGAGVGATTLGQGNAGTLRVNVSEQISVSGVSAASGKPSQIGASATVLPLAFQKAYGLSALPTGNSGDLILNTPLLQITDGGQVRVRHQGVGNAGTLYIKAATIALDRSGEISATTNFGRGGGINLQSNVIILRHGSKIIATAGGTGDGGNITIKAPIVAGFENSDIIANAVKGRGGNIQISTQGIFGLKLRPQLTPKNDITASSQFGISGNVQINNLTVDPSAGVVQLPVELVDPSQKIATGCNAHGSRFVATGRGGLPLDPNESVRSDRPWHDLRDVSQWQHGTSATSRLPTPTAPINEATRFSRAANGDMVLIAPPLSGNTEVSAASITCAIAQP